MYLNFKLIEIEGFQSIKKAVVEFDNQGIVLVRGVNNYDRNASSNGSGKSSIFESLCWAIYGKTSVGITDPTSRYYKDGCMVKVVFYIDEQEYTIIRSSKHKKLKSGVSVYKGKEDISARNKSDTDKIIKSDIIPFSQDIFLSTIFLSQNFSGRLTSLQPYGRKERIEILSDTANAVEDFRIKLSNLKSVYSSKIESLGKDEYYNIGTTDSLKSQIRSLESEIEYNEQNKPKGDINECNARLNKFTDYLTVLSSSYNDESDELSKLQIEINNKNNQIRNYMNQISVAQHEIDDMKNGKPCPTCGRPTLGNISKSAIVEREALVMNTNIMIDSIRSEIAKIEQEKANHSTNISTINNKIQATKMQISDLRNLISELSKFKDTTDDKKKVSELKNSVDSLGAELVKIQETKSVAEETNSVINHSLSLVSKQFRSYFLNEIVKFMNTKLSVYSSILFSESNDVISISADSAKSPP